MLCVFPSHGCITLHLNTKTVKRTGINFRDISTLLLDPSLMRDTIDALAQAPFLKDGVDVVVGGFVGFVGGKCFYEDA